MHRDNDWLLLEIETQKLFEKWVSFYKTQDMKINSALQSFPGITLDQIVYFEKCFEINVNVYSLQEDWTAQVIYK